jgi:hypothetical protein
LYTDSHLPSSASRFLPPPIRTHHNSPRHFLVTLHRYIGYIGYTGALLLPWRLFPSTHPRPSTHPERPAQRGRAASLHGLIVACRAFCSEEGACGRVEQNTLSPLRSQRRVCTSAFLPKPPRTPKELGFGGFRPSKLRLDIPFGLKTSASWRNSISDYQTFVPLVFWLTDFLFFGGRIFRQFKSRPMPPELPG